MKIEIHRGNYRRFLLQILVDDSDIPFTPEQADNFILTVRDKITGNILLEKSTSGDNLYFEFLEEDTLNLTNELYSYDCGAYCNGHFYTIIGKNDFVVLPVNTESDLSIISDVNGAEHYDKLVGSIVLPDFSLRIEEFIEGKIPSIETAFSEQQLAVLDSGITAEKVALYDQLPEQISSVSSTLSDGLSAEVSAVMANTLPAAVSSIMSNDLPSQVNNIVSNLLPAQVNTIVTDIISNELSEQVVGQVAQAVASQIVGGKIKPVSTTIANQTQWNAFVNNVLETSSRHDILFESTVYYITVQPAHLISLLEKDVVITTTSIMPRFDIPNSQILSVSNGDSLKINGSLYLSFNGSGTVSLSNINILCSELLQINNSYCNPISFYNCKISSKLIYSANTPIHLYMGSSLLATTFTGNLKPVVDGGSFYIIGSTGIPNISSLTLSYDTENPVNVTNGRMEAGYSTVINGTFDVYKPKITIGSIKWARIAIHVNENRTLVPNSTYMFYRSSSDFISLIGISTILSIKTDIIGATAGSGQGYLWITSGSLTSVDLRSNCNYYVDFIGL